MGTESKTTHLIYPVVQEAMNETTQSICAALLFPYWKVTCCNGSLFCLFFFFFFAKYQRAGDPRLPPPPIKPAARGSETHFLVLRLKVLLYTHIHHTHPHHTNRKQHSFMSLKLHTVEVVLKGLQQDRKVYTSHTHLVKFEKPFLVIYFLLTLYKEP